MITYSLKELQQILPENIAFLEVIPETLRTWLVWDYSGFSGKIVEQSENVYTFISKRTYFSLIAESNNTPSGAIRLLYRK